MLRPNPWRGKGKEEKRFARSANNPPFAVRLQRMGHPRCCLAAQLQSHAPLVRFAKAPVPWPLQTQAEGLAVEHEDGVFTWQSAQ
jgi:hypothetical protein